MAGWRMINESIFDEPEFRIMAELVIGEYFMIKGDAAGVCPYNEKVIAAACKTKKSVVKKTVEYFERIGKLEIAVDNSHLWWRGAINVTLFGGKATPKQKQNVVKRVLKWHYSELFGNNFAQRVLQLLETKYNFTIPIVLPEQSHSAYSYSYINNNINTGNNINNSSICKNDAKGEKNQPTSIKKEYEIEIKKLEELIQFSEFVHATRDCNFKKWLADHIEKYGIKKVQLGIESIIEHQQDPNHSWIVPPEPARCRRKISDWIGRQYEQSSEEFKKQKDDEELKKFLAEHPE